MAKKIADIEVAEFEDLLKDFYAEPQKRSKMTQEELKDLAERLNRKINIPLVKETGEEKILIKIILKIDNFLYDSLPNEFYDLVRSTDKGIDEREAKRLVRRLTKLANDKIDIPFLPEAVEKFVIRFVIGMVVKAARKKLDFDKVRAASDSMSVPDSDDEIEKMVED
ncbi:hypothetical protein D1164_10830 [Mariniphaga sediminis]|jgi:sugar-specific transcriptional regulator TrmB|uniref:Uncharacterized protein n=1 Tax=Mariniphaga sediminis TaxID=1628158 RepID=A0A399CZ93_9BACT|nr:hypothetical protein [Mariniphaga sediminis]RIH65075.1 hypothetical protein D1164_10830 [Mariniphaga sediminis]